MRVSKAGRTPIEYRVVHDRSSGSAKCRFSAAGEFGLHALMDRAFAIIGDTGALSVTAG
jgi:hypothetical protein